MWMNAGGAAVRAWGDSFSEGTRSDGDAPRCWEGCGEDWHCEHVHRESSGSRQWSRGAYLGIQFFTDCKILRLTVKFAFFCGVTVFTRNFADLYAALLKSTNKLILVERVTIEVRIYQVTIFLRAKAECFAHLSHCLGVCPSVRPSHSWSVSKRCKRGSRNLYCGLPQGV